MADFSSEEKGIRIGHWNFNHLTLDKFDQIKLFLLGKLGKPQLDVLLLNETFLKPNACRILFLRCLVILSTVETG